PASCGASHSQPWCKAWDNRNKPGRGSQASCRSNCPASPSCLPRPETANREGPGHSAFGRSRFLEGGAENPWNCPRERRALHKRRETLEINPSTAAKQSHALRVQRTADSGDQRSPSNSFSRLSTTGLCCTLLIRC